MTPIAPGAWVKVNRMCIVSTVIFGVLSVVTSVMGLALKLLVMIDERSP
jgi:hypothetical protein